MRGTFAAPPFCKTFKSDPVASIMRVSIELNVNVCVWACAREKKNSTRRVASSVSHSISMRALSFRP